jgi:pimeloyl-ACP methyl ester carboxylesterase
MANVVLVHGAVADGSSWRDVYESLKHSGHAVRIVQNPGTSLEADVAATLRVLDEVAGPVVLVGHSYGGVVITEAGNDPRVEALVYLAAFALDQGESIAALMAQSAGGEPPPFVVSKDGFLSIDKPKFHAVVCADLDASQASFLVDAQLPIGPGAIGGTVSAPRVEVEAELVPGRDGGRHHPARGTAANGRTGRIRRDRDQGQSRNLHLTA